MPKGIERVLKDKFRIDYRTGKRKIGFEIIHEQA